MDVADAFHRMKMPDHLCEYFGLPSVTASELGLRRLRGAELLPTDELVPLATSLPMGFSWSLFFAQDIDEEATSSVIDRCELLVDHGKPLLLRCLKDGRQVRHYVYVDNVGVFGSGRQVVEDTQELVVASFEKGLTSSPNLECCPTNAQIGRSSR